ncbi:MAG: hypothetical protein RL172_450 [Bacteroidota bacterium]|jgi:hypothetical protein
MTVKHLYTCLLAGSCFVSCAKKEVATPVVVPSAVASIPKPGGVFASAGSTTTAVLQHTETRGVLIRAFWKDIETTEGQFNFTTLDNQVAAIKAKGKKYSLSILAGGIGSPDWLIAQKKAPYYTYNFRGQPYQLPLIWDNTVLNYLGKLADELAAHFAADTSLMLVYIPQMTANGVEGHLNGFNQAAFEAAGYTQTKWIDASLQNARRFATAFSKKALAFEVHELFNNATPAATILNELWNDGNLNHRVGAAMWWISGNTTYQPQLLTVLKNFSGDIYCQVIDRSDNTASFPGGDYAKVFEQARQLRARYIEPWDYEFGISRWDAVFRDFNAFADTLKKY